MATTFPEIEQRIAALSEERARGDAFERVIAHFLRHDPVLGMRRIWTWLDWPGRQPVGVGPVDLGIDLVAEDERGDLVGVQVKHRLDPHSHLRWSDVSTALGFRPDLFVRRLIVTNAADRTANARKATVMTANTAWVMREDLLASPIDWSGALEAGSGRAAAAHVPREPRPYQAAAVADVIGSLGDHERTQLIMACGSGKTLVTLWVAEGRKTERVLVLVPTLLLLKQFRREWREAASLPFVDLAVCSDADTVEPDEWLVRADELGVPVTTDPSAIAAFLRGAGRRVIFATYASSARVAEAQVDTTVPDFDLVVADEAHRIAGVINLGVHHDRDHRVVLDAERIRAARRLFATATPRVYGRATRRRFDDQEDIEVASMDDETLFGSVAHQLWFREAVDLDVLTDYELVAVLVTDEEVADLVRERAGVIVDGKVLDAETLATLIAVRRAIDDLGLTRAITFHHTIARARGFALALSQIELTPLAPDAVHISGAMSVDERERVLHILKEPDRPTVVTNARCLTEGIDVPSLDAVAFVDPRSSAVDIVQAVGRVMRRAPGKKRGYVVVPVFLREADLADPEAAVEGSAFAPVLDVLRALRAHDPELTADASRIKASLGSRDAVAGGHIAQHVQLLGLTVDARRFERALELRFVKVSADPFEVGLVALRAYVAREGHARVPSAHVEGGVRLGMWVVGHRAHRRHGSLDPAREAELEAFPAWTWDPYEGDFREGLHALKAFVALHHHARVPPAYRDPDGYPLGSWVSVRRSEYRAGRLVPERAAILQGLPGWTWDKRSHNFDRGLEALHTFGRVHGHARVPRGYRAPAGFSLGSWVLQRRRDYRLGRLSPERVAALEAMPSWSWAPYEHGFDVGLRHLGEFAAAQGDCRVPSDFTTGDGFRLGRWVVNQRGRRKTLSSERAQALEAMSGWSWNTRTDNFGRGLQALRAYATRHGHTRVPRTYTDAAGFKLGLWSQSRRADLRLGRLAEVQAAALKAVPGWTDNAIEDRFREGLRALEEFAATNAHTRIPREYKTARGFPLGTWARHRREEHRAGRLSQNRQAALEAVLGWSWAASPQTRSDRRRPGHVGVTRGNF